MSVVSSRRRRSTAALKEALTKFKAAQRQIEQGLPPSNKQDPLPATDEWIRVVLPRQVAPTALSNYESMVRNHINPIIQQGARSRLTTQDVDQLIATKLEERSTSTVRRIRSVLSAGLEQGVIWGKI